MPSHKNQHYVPRCYLKPFTLGGEGRSISLFNLESGRGVRFAPVKDQCSRDYFYGADLKLEKVLQQSEGTYAEVLADIVLGGPLNDAHRAVLRHFCYLQYCRTDAAARRNALITAEIADFAFGPEGSPELDDPGLDPVQVAMRTFATSMRLVYDLKVCLLRNKTPQPFITSDNPAILTNRWCLLRPDLHKSAGAGAAGALFLLPLTPEILCVAYDGDIYSISHRMGWADVEKVADVDALNQHQFLDCAANVYFKNWSDLPNVQLAYGIAAPARPAARYRVHVAVLEHEDEWGQRFKVVPREDLKRDGQAMIHVQAISAKPTQWPSVIAWRPKRLAYSNGSATGYVRRWSLEAGFATGQGYRRVVV